VLSKVDRHRLAETAIWHISGTQRIAVGKRAFGNTRKLPSGRWQARYTGPDGNVHYAPSTFFSKMDADAWLYRERQVLESPETWVPPKLRLEQARLAEEAARRPTFGKYAEKWIEDRRNSDGDPLRPTTRDKYRSNLRVHLVPTFGETPLNEVTRESVRAWYATLEAGRAAKADSYQLLHAIFRTAVENELLSMNPVPQIRGAGVKKSRKRIEPATLDELAVIVDAMPARLKLLPLLATWCALRSGELRELRRLDISTGLDADGNAYGSVSIRRAVTQVRIDGEKAGRRTVPKVGDPKTAAGVRVVSIPGALVPVVEAHLRDHVDPGPRSLLFYAARDRTQTLSESTLNGRATIFDADGDVVKAGFGWREARRVAGREDLTLHDLRHTGASLAGQAGASIAELQYRLGHTTPSMAMHYQHATQARDQELARRLSAQAEEAAGRHSS